MAEAPQANSVPRLRLAALLAPIALFYAGLLLAARDLPLLDDYDAGLNFANHLITLPTLRARLLYFAAAQHSDYKLFFAHAFVWLELALTGHINFWFLSLLGNASVLLLAAVLWRMFLPHAPLTRRLALFLPVTLLLFQYGYVETLNWPLPGLQTLPVLAFAVASLYLLQQPTALAGALATLTLAIASNANGFLIVIPGTLMLVLRRRWRALPLWLATTAAMAALYAYRYHPTPLAADAAHPGGLLHPHITYLLGFLGAAGRYLTLPGAVLLGLALCLYFAFAAHRGLLRHQPVVLYCLLFILLTGLGVAGLRAQDGLLQSVSSRYRMYSDLLLIFAWFTLVQQLRLDTAPSLRRSRPYLSALSLSALFCLAMDANGGRTLLIRHRGLVGGMARYEHSRGTLTPMYSVDPTRSPGPADAEHARQVLLQSERLGIYHPPTY